MEMLSTLVGVLYLYWEYKGDKRLWLAGTAMPALSLAVYWQAGLYADFGINVYYLLAALYGLYAWHRHAATQGEEKPVTAMPLGRLPRVVLLALVLWGALTYVLVRFTPSTVPATDAFTTALSVVGMWMLARKWKEQWLAWIAVDIVSAGLYFYKSLYFYCALYTVYTLVSVAGYRAWARQVKPNT